MRTLSGSTGAKSVQSTTTRFLESEHTAATVLLAPWLPMAGLAMIHAPRGIGKTHIALGTAWAVATGIGIPSVEGA